ncbi:MAG: 5-formyltetrahydrofolate cyclo-ligase [Candidatus Zixiibacteriota bacterium]
MMNAENEVVRKKEWLRNDIWTLLEQRNVAIFPLPVRGRIPNFIGSDKAADLVRTLPEWKEAKIVFSCPDSPQKKIREFALKDGKILIMPSPRLKHGFLQINPQDVRGKEETASSIKGAFKYGNTVEDMPRPDLIITSCVAVDRAGWRLGKGGGYGDIEVKKIKDEFGEIPVVTTVHPLQLVESVPHVEHDARVDLILTPDTIYRIPTAN